METSEGKRELSDAFLRAVVVTKRMDFSDTKVEGLQIRVSPKSKKTFAERAPDNRKFRSRYRCRRRETASKSDEGGSSNF